MRERFLDMEGHFSPRRTTLLDMLIYTILWLFAVLSDCPVCQYKWFFVNLCFDWYLTVFRPCYVKCFDTPMGRGGGYAY